MLPTEKSTFPCVAMQSASLRSTALYPNYQPNPNPPGKSLGNRGHGKEGDIEATTLTDPEKNKHFVDV